MCSSLWKCYKVGISAFVFLSRGFRLHKLAFSRTVKHAIMMGPLDLSTLWALAEIICRVFACDVKGSLISVFAYKDILVLLANCFAVHPFAPAQSSPPHKLRAMPESPPRSQNQDGAGSPGRRRLRAKTPSRAESPEAARPAKSQRVGGDIFLPDSVCDFLVLVILGVEALPPPPACTWGRLPPPRAPPYILSRLTFIVRPEAHLKSVWGRHPRKWQGLGALGRLPEYF